MSDNDGFVAVVRDIVASGASDFVATVNHMDAIELGFFVLFSPLYALLLLLGIIARVGAAAFLFGLVAVTQLFRRSES
jgi:hypothetical protein